MPIYEYACKKCGAHVEILQKLSDKPLTKCGKCGGRLEKQWSTSGIQFKGSGWYVTDYARKGADKKSEGAGELKSDAKGEAKPEGKAEAAPAGKSGAKSEGAKGGDEKKTPRATSTSKGASKD